MQNLSSQPATTQLKVPIWHRPIHVPRRVWKAIAIVTACSAITVAVYPFAYGAIVWAGHRSVPFRGGSLPLPFLWIHDPDERPYGSFSIHKSSWSQAESSVSFSALSTGQDQASFRARWLEMHKRWNSKIAATHIGTDTKDAFHGQGGQPLLCSETEMFQRITMDCIADDSKWHFQFFGAAEDAIEADQSIRYLLSHESEFSQPPS